MGEKIKSVQWNRVIKISISNLMDLKNRSKVAVWGGGGVIITFQMVNEC